MPAATIEQSSNDTTPVFVAGGRHRNHAVRLAAATLGLLLAGWLTALAAGLIGFSPLPELTLPGTGSAQTAPAPPDQGPQPARVRDAKAHASPIASRQADGRRQGERGGERHAGRRIGRLWRRDRRRCGPGRKRSGGTGSTSPVTGAAPHPRRRPRPRAAPPPQRAPGTRRRSRRPPAVGRAPARRAATPPTRLEGRSPPIRRARQRGRDRIPANASPRRLIRIAGTWPP